MLKLDERDLDILARTIYGEARGEFAREDGGLKSLQAVGWVIKNRYRLKIYGQNVREVCQKPWQFSCWNPGDPNRTTIENASVNDLSFRFCLLAALQVTTESIGDPTFGADHYHSRFIDPPFWADKAKATARIANHVFYKLGG